VAVIACEAREGGQRWTDGVLFYADNGTVTFHEGGCAVDLVEYIGPFPVPDQSAEIARLQAEWQSEFTAAQQLRSEIERLQAEIERLQAELRGYAAESHRQLRTLQASHDSATATLRAEQRGAQAAFLAAIKTFLEASR
jgi:hypothetical protein